MATPDYNQGNERREATSPRELKRASALKEKAVPKATTQDSCFSHMIRTGQSLGVRAVEVQPAERDSQPVPAPAAPAAPRVDRAYPARRGCTGPLLKAMKKKLKTLWNACLEYAGLQKTFSSSDPHHPAVDSSLEKMHSLVFWNHAPLCQEKARLRKGCLNPQNRMVQRALEQTKPFGWKKKSATSSSRHSAVNKSPRVPNTSM